MKIIPTLCCLAALFTSTLQAQDYRDADAILANQDEVYVNYNCGYPTFEVPPLIVEGRTFVELNTLFTAMGIALTWDGETQKITGTKDGTVIELWIGSTTAYVDGQSTTLDAAPFIATPYNRTMVPVAFISEATGADTSWEGNSRTVIVNDAPCTVAADWQSGALNSDIVDWTLLRNLSIKVDEKTIWKSNNPEAIEGTGWMMQSSRTDGARGGQSTPLQGCNDIYLFHINKSGSDKYVHLLASNPNDVSASVTLSGSMYNNTEKPLYGKGTGLNYQVAYDWLYDTPRTNIQRIVSPYTAQELVRIKLDSMIDGRYEICSDEGVYLYTVATNTGSSSDAINLSQGNVAPGFIAEPDVDKFGREAGIYSGSGVKSVQSIVLPDNQGYIGFNFNSTNKIYTYLQDQTSDAIMNLSDSSAQTHGNYGHHYNVTLHLINNNSVDRSVTFRFGSNVTNSPVSFTWNSPALVNGSLVDLFTTPSSPSAVIDTYTIPANGSRNINLELYVPGLITTNQQLILEAN
ncbi:N-acetylmuramoyl-L-alanine amidase [Saliniradius amylolyticus]|uniref:N-acetylmuramoyl-L-alanine amidase n=1 Tax=Saliniradius amylolyticus TaxID=2183582 RepID=A0A2S2E305_9ALTE|nr:DUF3370 family protein [Saliniradius amylolyticus]AWL11979.1 N-acetylmuramoyl-L-alanine amidase [Saliniradius amylolyticus]